MMTSHQTWFFVMILNFDTLLFTVGNWHFLPVGQIHAAELEVTCLSLCQNIPIGSKYAKKYYRKK
jgi:hypothetical protein